MVTKKDIKDMSKSESNLLREKIAKQGVDQIIKELNAISDAQLMAGLGRIKVRIKIS